MRKEEVCLGELLSYTIAALAGGMPHPTVAKLEKAGSRPELGKGQPPKDLGGH